MNIAATILGCFFIYLVVYELTDGIDKNRKCLFAVATAAIYATNPIVWFYGCVSEIYAVESFLVASLIYLLVLSKKRRSLLPLTSIMFGLAGGVRLTTELFLLPAYLLVLWGSNKRILITSLLCFVVSNLLWFIPVVYFSDGLVIYLNALFSQGTRESEITAGFDSENVLEIFLLLIQAVTIPVLVMLLSRFRKIRIEPIELCCWLRYCRRC
ncbi:MAG TPA: DUF2723 domain-containing protein [Acidobacteriota bacterium]|nr:DUF2723 domain-containing protein [Acidobacteriota bacterium]